MINTASQVICICNMSACLSVRDKAGTLGTHTSYKFISSRQVHSASVYPPSTAPILSLPFPSVDSTGKLRQADRHRWRRPITAHLGRQRRSPWPTSPSPPLRARHSLPARPFVLRASWLPLPRPPAHLSASLQHTQMGMATFLPLRLLRDNTLPSPSLHVLHCRLA